MQGVSNSDFQVDSSNKVVFKHKQPSVIIAVWAACGHCKNLMKSLHGKSFPLNVFIVDADENTPVVELLKISGFPTIFFAKNGNIYKYKGSRNPDELIKNMNSFKQNGM
jgi:glutaredoxin